MSDLTPEELEGIYKAISKDPSFEEGEKKLPLKNPSRLSFATLPEDEPLPKAPNLPKELGTWKQLKVKIDVIYGNKHVSLGDLQNLKKGSVLSLDQLADEPVELMVHGKVVAKGEICTVEGKYAVRVLSIEN